MSTRTAAIWEFYTIDQMGNRTKIQVKVCKAPEKTGVWKVLQTWLNREESIQSIGYSKIESLI
jgi:hypothetical protein